MEQQLQHLLPRPISRIFFRGCAEALQAALRSRLSIHEGALLSDEHFQRSLQTAKELNERLEILVTQAPTRDEYLKLPPELRRKMTPPTSDDGVNVTIYDPAFLPQRIRVEGCAQEFKLIAKVTLVRPPEAPGDERDTGLVKLSIVVGKDGTVISANPVAGPEILFPAAVEAAKQWTYRPTLLDGIPVQVQTNIEVGFTAHL